MPKNKTDDRTVEIKMDDKLYIPAFFGIKPKILSGNRRYYDKSNVNLLKKIKFLLKDQGMTINGVKKLLNSSEPNNLDEISNKSISADNLRNKITNISKIISDLKKLK